jgi:prepilin-type N-terminal cleavage/methylation domain-containing protein
MKAKKEWRVLDSLRRSSSKKRGFTLIELLIVIAIILILIAIALPNFLEAQIRAKVARAKGELRTLGIAMESYYLDFNVYPPETEGDFRTRFEFGHSWLTSPIPYITSVPEDPFAGTSVNGIRTFESGGLEQGVMDTRCVWCMVTWVIYSSGPSEASEPAIRSADPHYNYSGSGVFSYAPTNGTRSAGTMHLWGGDGFWIGVNIGIPNKNIYKQMGGSADVGLPVDGIVYLHKLPPDSL